MNFDSKKERKKQKQSKNVYCKRNIVITLICMFTLNLQQDERKEWTKLSVKMICFNFSMIYEIVESQLKLSINGLCRTFNQATEGHEIFIVVQNHQSSTDHNYYHLSTLFNIFISPPSALAVCLLFCLIHKWFIDRILLLRKSSRNIE